MKPMSEIPRSATHPASSARTRRGRPVRPSGRSKQQVGEPVVVLPEMAGTGYSFDTRDKTYAYVEPVPDAPTVRPG